jgi:hypothetical protein
VEKLRANLEVAIAFVSERYKWFLAPVIVSAVVIGSWLAVGVVTGDDGPAPDPNRSIRVSQEEYPPHSPARARSNRSATPAPTPAPVIPVVVDTSVDFEEIMGPEAPDEARVEVPIFLQGASDLGSLEFVLVFEPDTLKFLAAEPGTLASDALIETNLRSDGRVWVGIVEPTGVTGDGSIAVLSFETLEGGASESPLVLEDISSYRASTYLDSLQQPTPGHFGLDQGSLAPPSLVFH